jgi:hypothetical protein
LESQRVKCLTEGYLRGWLTFEYPQPTSRVREEIILNHIQDERLYSLLQHKLLIETVLLATAGNRTKQVLEPIFETSRSLIGLKLPSALPKDTIKKKEELSKSELDEWREFLQKANKK